MGLLPRELPAISGAAEFPPAPSTTSQLTTETYMSKDRHPERRPFPRYPPSALSAGVAGVARDRLSQPKAFLPSLSPE
jgi:hypothetical protein